MSLGFLQARAMYPGKNSDLQATKFSTCLLPIEFLNRFFPLSMQSRTEGRCFMSVQMDQPTFWLHHTRSNETFSMELANLRLSNPSANCRVRLGRNHTEVRIWIYFEMKANSKFLHELDFVLTKLILNYSVVNSVSATQGCVCMTVHCSIDDSGDRQMNIQYMTKLVKSLHLYLWYVN